MIYQLQQKIQKLQENLLIIDVDASQWVSSLHSQERPKPLAQFLIF